MDPILFHREFLENRDCQRELILLMDGGIEVSILPYSIHEVFLPSDTKIIDFTDERTGVKFEKYPANSFCKDVVSFYGKFKVGSTGGKAESFQHGFFYFDPTKIAALYRGECVILPTPDEKLAEIKTIAKEVEELRQSIQ